MLNGATQVAGWSRQTEVVTDNDWKEMKTPAALEMVRGDDITFTGDVVTDTGDTGVDFADGTQNSTLSGSTVTYTAANGVNIGEADD